MSAELKRMSAGGALPDVDLPIDPEVIFTDAAGTRKPGIEKRQNQYLIKISFLKPFLKPDEKILLVVPACSPWSPAEQLLTGWSIFYIKRCLLVFTNRRILHLPTRANYSPRHSVAQLIYGDCQSIEVKGGGLVVKYKSGRSEKFQYVGGDRRKVKAILKAVRSDGPTSPKGVRTFLCPRCTAELSRGVYMCPSCRLEFKSKAEARRISWLYPGGGYFYTGHRFLGLSDAIGEALLMFFVIVFLIDTASGEEGALATLVFFAAVLVVEKLITVYHSSHFVDEYIPKQQPGGFGVGRGNSRL